MSLKNNRRAMELPARKVVVIILVVFVLIFVPMNLGKVYNSVKDGISSMTGATKNYSEIYGDSRGITGAEQFEREGADKLDPSSFDSLEDFATRNNIELAKLQAIIEVESRGNAIYEDGHPVVRFECIKFNLRKSGSERVPCDTSSNKYGSRADTGREAFDRAITKNREEALLVTSYGFAQIMGFNYREAGHSSVEDFYAAMFDEDEQIKSFLTFLSNHKGGIIIDELKKDNTDWRIVAENYNGPDYESNNYHVKLADEYGKFQNLA